MNSHDDLLNRLKELYSNHKDLIGGDITSDRGRQWLADVSATIGALDSNAKSEFDSLSDKVIWPFTDQIRGPTWEHMLLILQRVISTETTRNSSDISDTENVMPQINPRDVFVVHGRNVRLKDELFTFLRALDLRPMEWGEALKATGQASPYIGDVLETAFSRAQAIVVLMTPDDQAFLKEIFLAEDDQEFERRPTGQPRPNVLFEAGMAFGHDSRRTILVQIGKLRPISDIQGRHVVKLNNTTQIRQELADKLTSAGCAVITTGKTDWHTAGELELSEEEATEEDEEPASSGVILDENARRGLKELMARYYSERDSEPVNIDDAQYIVGETLDQLFHFIAQIDRDQRENLHSLLEKLIKEFDELLKHEVLIDGGVSYQKFWEKGNNAYDRIANLLNMTWEEV